MEKQKLGLMVSTMATSVLATAQDQTILPLNIYGFTRYCDFAPKDNTTPCYVKIRYPTDGGVIKVGAFGATSTSSSATKHNCTFDGNLNSVTKVSIRIGFSYRIRNAISEMGFSYACLGFSTPTVDGSMQISGVWSPDSIGSYDYAYA